MIRLTALSLGRWGSRDFMRGRTKRGGAVHTRHTHGSKGRYKRLSTRYNSIRDGRRHGPNHMQGGLGIKIGGGLFGLRIPRQHQLSTMTKEDFDLEIYGHPNITNPYRERMEEHPSLKSIMMNAAISLQLVVLLPRVSRGPMPHRSTENRVLHETAGLPVTWSAAAKEVAAALQSTLHGCTPASSSPLSIAPETLPHVQVHFTTLETSVCCSSLPLSLPTLQPTMGHTALEEALQSSLRTLYQSHCRQGSRLVPVGAQRHRSSREAGDGGAVIRPSRSIAFYGPSLRCPLAQHYDAATSASLQKSSGAAAAAVSKCAASPPRIGQCYTSAALAAVQEAEGEVAALTVPSGHPVKERHSPMTTNASMTMDSVAASGKADEHLGLAALLRQLRKAGKEMLCMCLRPALLHGDEASCLALAEGGIESAGQRSNAQFSSTWTEPRAPASSRRVLKADVDANRDVGVWQQAATPTAELLRWHYSAHDPRAHNSDALSHEQRRLEAILLVDMSILSSQRPTRRDSQCAAVAGGDEGAATSRSSLMGVDEPTLLPRRTSELLDKMGYRVVAEPSFTAVMLALSEWSPAYQWSRYRARRSPPAASVKELTNQC